MPAFSPSTAAMPGVTSRGDDPLGPSSLPAWVGRATLDLVAYLGGLAILAAALFAVPFTRRRDQPRLLPAIARQLDDLLRVGLPWLAVMHVAFAAFLSMQAYFRATIAESNGAVVGLGLMRSISPLVTGFSLSGILAVRAVVTLKNGLKRGLDDDPDRLIDRDIAAGHAPDPRPLPDPARIAFVRVASAALAGPLLVIWGTALGVLVGLGLSRMYLGVSSGTFFGLFFDMLQVNDVFGVVVTGAGYSALSSLISCHEGLRLAARSEATGVAPTSEAALGVISRAALLSAVAMLLVDAAWFSLTYISGSPFGVGMDAPPSGR